MVSKGGRRPPERPVGHRRAVQPSVPRQDDRPPIELVAPPPSSSRAPGPRRPWYRTKQLLIPFGFLVLVVVVGTIVVRIGDGEEPDQATPPTTTSHQAATGTTAPALQTAATTTLPHAVQPASTPAGSPSACGLLRDETVDTMTQEKLLKVQDLLVHDMDMHANAIVMTNAGWLREKADGQPFDEADAGEHLEDLKNALC